MNPDYFIHSSNHYCEQIKSRECLSECWSHSRHSKNGSDGRGKKAKGWKIRKNGMNVNI